MTPKNQKSTNKKEASGVCSNGKKKLLLLLYLYHHPFFPYFFILGSEVEQIVSPWYTSFVKKKKKSRIVRLSVLHFHIV